MRLRTWLDRFTSPRVQLRITTVLLTLIVVTLLFRWATGTQLAPVAPVPWRPHGLTGP